MTTLKQVWKALKPDQKRKMAANLDTSYVYMSQLANDYCQPGKHFKVRLDKEVAKWVGVLNRAGK